MTGQEKKSGSPRRDEIIKIATALFLDQGFSGTSMAQLADACGIQKASFYHHFKNKDELFIACVINGYEGAINSLAALERDADLSDEQRIEHALDVLYDVSINSPTGRLSPLIAEVSRAMPVLAERFFDEYIALQRRTLRQIVMIGVEAGTFREPDFDVFYHLLFGPIVTLSLSREMFATLPDLDTRFPTETVKRGHIAAMLAFLRDGKPEEQ